MAGKLTEHSKFISEFPEPGETLYIRADQRLAEIMCKRQASRDNKILMPKFWNNKEWLKEFRLQLKHAKYLLDKYSIDIIIKAINHRKCYKVYSLGLKSVIEPVCVEILKTTPNPTESKTMETVNIMEKPRAQFSNKTLFSKLKELEDGT